MTSRLRHIAVHAEEPRAGHFVWVLSEQADATTWNEVQRAETASATYRKAMADGLHALQALSDDPDTGPRTRAGKPQRGADGPGDDASRQEPSHRKTVFGFGPVR